jgi:hypothetical protein
MTSHRASTARLLVLTTLTVWLVFSCTQETINSSRDSTPPTLAWHVENRTTQTTSDFSGSGKLNGTRDDDFLVTLTAADPQGIRDTFLGGESSLNCASDAIGQSTDALYAGQSQTLTPDADGNVASETSLGLHVTPQSTCEADLNWQSTTIQLFGKGVNYADGMTDGTLTILVRP